MLNDDHTKLVLTVTELTEEIRSLLEDTFGFLWVAGEVSNLRRPSSGHVYFTLKDEKAQVRAVLFRQSSARLGFDLEDGMEVLCRGRVSVYSPRGEYQIIVDAAEPRGLGALQRAFEALKKRLEAEGLFDAALKKAIPFLPRRIGVVTSPSGAAVRDILNITGRRFPSVDILIAPVRVQGDEAPPEICDAIALLNEHRLVDVIILARGGGSLEDLFPFNDERVARAVRASRVPVISAVGHEIDFTIADFAADLRAPTPSAAAELVVPMREDLRLALIRDGDRLARGLGKKIHHLRDRSSFLKDLLKTPRRRIEESRLRADETLADLEREITRILRAKEERLGGKLQHLRAFSPAGRVGNDRFRLDHTGNNMIAGLKRAHGERTSRVRKAGASLDALSPLSVLHRGYGITRKHPDGPVLRDASDLIRGDRVSTRLHAGSFVAEVLETAPGEE